MFFLACQDYLSSNPHRSVHKCLKSLSHFCFSLLAAGQIASHLEVDQEARNYFPLVYFNEFWLLREYLVPLNETVQQVPLRLDVYRLPQWKFMLYNQMEESFSIQVSPRSLMRH